MSTTVRFKRVPEDEGKIIYPDKAEKDKYSLEVSRRYREKWRDENKTKLSMRFSHDYEEDVIEKLDSLDDKIGYVRGLIRADISKEKEKAES